MAENQKKTRERVLNSACRVFGEKGFRETTVAEICGAADANIAAVNYYFGSKTELYREVWRRALEVNDAKYKFTDKDLKTPTTWLRAHIRGRVLSIFDASHAGCFPRLLQREMADPTDMTRELRETFLYPRVQQAESYIHQLLGKRATKQQVRCCVINIVSLYAFLNLGKMAREKLFHGEAPTEEQLGAIVAQMQTFALAAVEGVRVAIEKEELT